MFALQEHSGTEEKTYFAKIEDKKYAFIKEAVHKEPKNYHKTIDWDLRISSFSSGDTIKIFIIGT